MSSVRSYGSNATFRIKIRPQTAEILGGRGSVGPLPKHSVVVDWTLVSSGGGGGGGGKQMPNILLLLTGHLGQVVEEEEEEDQLDR